VDELGGEYEPHSLGLRFGENFSQSLKRCGMGMADGDGLAFFASAAQGEF
jgi:hypothetical protein